MASTPVQALALMLHFELYVYLKKRQQRAPCRLSVSVLMKKCSSETEYYE